MYKSYLMLADNKLKRKNPVMSANKEDAVNCLYSEGLAMAMVFSEEVYLCVIDEATGKSSAIYEISQDGELNKISLCS